MGILREDGQPSSARKLDDTGEFDTAVTAAIGSDAHESGSNADGGIERGNPLPTGFLLSDRFEILEHVHTSSMSHVYKALDKGADEGARHVAIKMLRRTADLDTNADRLLQQEAAKARKLQHKNVVRVFNVERHEERCYLVMEWLEGKSLNELLQHSRERPLAANLVEDIISGVVAGVGHAHDRDIVHADLNPSNVIVTDADVVKLLDFGIARYADERDHPDDDVPPWATYNYASPQVLNGKTPTKADDVFSLACLIYRLRAGRHPFGRRTSLQAMDAKFVVDPIPETDIATWTILKHGLAYKRRPRPRGVAVFLLSPHRNPTPATGPERRWPLPKQRPVALAAAGAVALGVLLWAYVSGDREEPAAVPAATNAIVDNAEPARTTTAPATNEPAEDITQLLDEASAALADQRIVGAEETSARNLYRAILAQDPNNLPALSGLRAISDDFVQRAISAIRADDPVSANVDLEIARETLPDNPSLPPVLELLRIQGDNTLAEARLAIARGARERAAALLTEAENYAHIDGRVIRELREDITRGALAARFQDQLAIVDDHIAAERLLAPDTGNAHASLLDLQRQYGNNRQLQAYTERFAERLLTRAALATAMQQFDEAQTLLRAVGSLRVLEEDAATAQSTLELAIAQHETNAARREAETVAETIAATTSSQPAGSATAASGSVLPSGIKADTEIAKSQYSKLSDLAIQEYVEPPFPALAEERNQTGFVELAFNVNTDGSTGAVEVLGAEPGELFVTSAMSAVSRWRFAQREDVARTRVRLTFVLPPP